MQLPEIYEAIQKIESLTFTTLDGTTMHSRIVHVTGQDEEGIYFLTMNSKPFYRQLQANSQVALCGIYPTSRAEGKNPVGQPAFVPGYTFRLTGEVRELSLDTVREKAEAGRPLYQYFLEELSRYPAERFFCIHKGKGEIFDFDFELEHRDHKVLRTRFSFGGATHNPAGCRITGDCIACGLCAEACTFKAIEEGEPYRINGSRCDECGSCVEACPQGAIELPLTI